jgi:hypothetical protein
MSIPCRGLPDLAQNVLTYVSHISHFAAPLVSRFSCEAWRVAHQCKKCFKVKMNLCRAATHTAEDQR